MSCLKKRRTKKPANAEAAVSFDWDDLATSSALRLISIARACESREIFMFLFSVVWNTLFETSAIKRSFKKEGGPCTRTQSLSATQVQTMALGR